MVEQDGKAVAGKCFWRVKHALHHPAARIGGHALPAEQIIDDLFGRQGVAAYARRRVVERMLYSPEALAGDGFAILLDHIAERGSDPAYWRAAARLLKAGRPARAAGVARALLRAG